MLCVLLQVIQTELRERGCGIVMELFLRDHRIREDSYEDSRIGIYDGENIHSRSLHQTFHFFARCGVVPENIRGEADSGKGGISRRFMLLKHIGFHYPDGTVIAIHQDEGIVFSIVSRELFFGIGDAFILADRESEIQRDDARLLRKEEARVEKFLIFPHIRYHDIAAPILKPHLLPVIVYLTPDFIFYESLDFFLDPSRRHDARIHDLRLNLLEKNLLFRSGPFGDSMYIFLLLHIRKQSSKLEKLKPGLFPYLLYSSHR